MLHTYGELSHTHTHAAPHIFLWKHNAFHIRRLVLHTFQLRRSRCQHMKMLHFSGFADTLTHLSQFSLLFLFPIQCFDSSDYLMCQYIVYILRICEKFFCFFRFVVLLDKTIRDWRKYKQINKHISFINTSFGQKCTAIKSISSYFRCDFNLIECENKLCKLEKFHSEKSFAITTYHFRWIHSLSLSIAWV